MEEKEFSTGSLACVCVFVLTESSQLWGTWPTEQGGCGELLAV